MANMTRRHVLDMYQSGIVTERPDGDEGATVRDASLDGGVGTEIAADEGRRVINLLRQINKVGEMECVKSLSGGLGRVLFAVKAGRFKEHPSGRSGQITVTAELWITRVQSGTMTKMTVTIRQVPNGACWLNLQANPTSLLIGTNALAAALGSDLKRGQERLQVLRFPFDVLRQILREADPTFDWSSSTSGRLRRRDFALHNMQVATYLPLGEAPQLGRFLNLLYAVYCTPIVDESWGTLRIGEYFKVRVDAMIDDAGRTTGVMFRRTEDKAGHALVTVNFYDKLITLSDQERTMLRAKDKRFLEENLRVDITLHRPMLKQLATVSGVADACTAAGFAQAVATLDMRRKRGDGPGFDKWLMGRTLNGYLRLPALLRFDPALWERAKRKLAGYKHLMAVWDHWVGGSADTAASNGQAPGEDCEPVSLRQLLQTRNIPVSTIRSNLAAVRKVGVDPELPPIVLQRMAMFSSVWGFTDAEASRFARALAEGNSKELDVLLGQSKEFLQQARLKHERLARLLDQPAAVPAIRARGHKAKRLRQKRNE
ncbi:hypothetical protein [Falsiroseomonas sp. E2-1-a20]|uniref:hypothetical protein n=1 Tax=Falsiroseomonas sp. E2-1-a20 TaxID=3239300 RepID=UPI003F418AE5